jgi:hypothetical protein
MRLLMLPLLTYRELMVRAGRETCVRRGRVCSQRRVHVRVLKTCCRETGALRDVNYRSAGGERRVCGEVTVDLELKHVVALTKAVLRRCVCAERLRLI